VKGSTANRLGDEESISASRARSRRTRFASLLHTTEKQNRGLIAVGCAQFRPRCLSSQSGI
jgi:hypothetical protein